MRNIRKFKSLIAFIVLVSFSVNIYAVFEGRNDNLQQYQSVRNQVDMASIGDKAYSTDPTGEVDENGNPKGSALGEMPISDTPWFIFLLGGLSFGIYAVNRKKKWDMN